MIALKIQGYDAQTRKERALELIKRVGLESHTHHKASKLSGGQKQRAVIARALAKDCPIIVADEPTGNLDSESSALILGLLQEIAKDKLVIVVTHNYEEVAEFATRRIRLFDGEVVEDKELKQHETAKEKTVLQSYFMTTWGLITFALRNLLRTPRRTVFQTFVFLFIVAIFTLTYGFFVMVTNDVDGGGYNGTFSNVTEKRIIVTKKDSTSFTEAELISLKNINRVTGINEHDVINDMSVTAYTLFEEGQYKYLDNREYFVNPAISLDPSELVEGRLPENINEIVIEQGMYGDYGIGDTVNLTLGGWLRYDDTTIEQVLEDSTDHFTVVGIVATLRPFEYRGMLYFHMEFLERDDVISKAYLSGWYNSPYRIEASISIGEKKDYADLGYITYVFDDTLEVDEMIITEGMSWFLTNAILNDNPLFDFESNPTWYEDYPIDISGISTFSEKTVTLTIVEMISYDDWERMQEFVGEDNFHFEDFVVMHPDAYYSIFDDAIYQPSVYVTSLYDANRVVEDIEELGFNAIYPQNIEDPFTALGKIILTVVFGGLMLILLVIMYFITYLVLKNIQEAKKKDFLIFRSIGASKASLNRVTIFELLTLTIVSVIIVFTLLILNGRFYWIRQIATIMNLYTVGNYIFLFFILGILAFLLGRRFNSRIFNKSVITSLKAE